MFPIAVGRFLFFSWQGDMFFCRFCCLESINTTMEWDFCGLLCKCVCFFKVKKVRFFGGSGEERAAAVISLLRMLAVFL